MKTEHEFNLKKLIYKVKLKLKLDSLNRNDKKHLNYKTNKPGRGLYPQLVLVLLNFVVITHVE